MTSTFTARVAARTNPASTDLATTITQLMGAAEAVHFGDSTDTVLQRFQIIRIGGPSKEAQAIKQTDISENERLNRVTDYAKQISEAAETQSLLRGLATLIATAPLLQDPSSAETAMLNTRIALRDSLHNWFGANVYGISDMQRRSASEQADNTMDAMLQSMHAIVPAQGRAHGS